MEKVIDETNKKNKTSRDGWLDPQQNNNHNKNVNFLWISKDEWNKFVILKTYPSKVRII